ncbi:MAG: TRAP transporter small permease [Pygmaiobacter sp.]
MKFFRTIDRGYSKLLTWVNAFTAFMVFGLMLLITADVVSRTAFNHPFQGVSEIVSNCIIVLCFLEIPFVLMKGTHVRSTMIYDKADIRGKAIIDIIACILGIIVFSCVIGGSWSGMMKAMLINDAEIAGSVRIPTTPGRVSVIVGSGMMILEFILQGIRNAIKLINPDAFAEDRITKEESAIPEGGQAI